MWNVTEQLCVQQSKAAHLFFFAGEA